MTDEKIAMHSRCLPRTAGHPQDLGSLCRGPGGTLAQATSPSAKGTGSPHCPLGSGAMALSPSLMQTTLPSFPAGPSASSLPSTRCPASPWLMKPRQKHHLLCSQQGCRGQEMARHTPPSPLGATLPAPPYQALHPPPWLLWGQHAGARCLPTPLPRAPAELSIQEQGLCPGLTGCPA